MIANCIDRREKKKKWQSGKEKRDVMVRVDRVTERVFEFQSFRQAASVRTVTSIRFFRFLTSRQLLPAEPSSSSVPLVGILFISYGNYKVNRIVGDERHGTVL